MAVRQCLSSKCESCSACLREHAVLSGLLHCLHWEAGDTFAARMALSSTKMKCDVKF